MKLHISAFLGFILLLCSCQSAPEQEGKVLKGQAFGTTYAISYYGAGQPSERIQQGIDSVIAVVNQSMSTYIPDSDISKINRGDSTIVVDQMFKEVFSLSRNINQKTNGYFDPTVGGLRNAYGFGDAQPITRIDSSRLDSMMRYVGLDKVRINQKGQVIKTSPLIYLDFNAIAKGYGIDRIAMFLEQQSVSDYLIELGGELRASGLNRETQKPWTVGVEDIHSGITDRSYVAVVALKDMAMASSGNYRKYRIDEQSGKQYVHTINPISGAAEQSDVLSATVIARDCATADAYATSFMAMGFEKSNALLASGIDVEAYLIYAVSKDSTAVYRTEGFEKLQLR